MAAGDISIRFAAEGDQTLKSAIQAIDNQIKALNEGVKASTEAMKGMGDQEDATAQKNALLARSVEANKQKMELLSRQYDDAKSKLQTLAEEMEKAKNSQDPAAIDKATNAYNRQSVEVSKLEAAMNRTQTQITAAQNELESGGQSAESFGEKVGKLADQLQIKLAGEALKGVVDGLEKFGSKCLEIGQNIWKMASDASVMADDMITLSTKTGISTEKLQEYGYAARFVDTEVSTITGSMQKLTKNMASTSETTQDAFKKLGVSVTDSKGRMKETETVFWQAIDALGKVANETERDQIAMTIFGKSAQELNPLIKAGSDAWYQYADEAKKAGLVLSDDAMGALGSFNDGLQRVDATVDSLKNQLAAALAPALTTVADAVANAGQKFTQWLQSSAGKEEIKRIADLVSGLAQRFTQNLVPGVEKAIGIFQNVGGAVQFLSQNMDKIVSVIKIAVTIFASLKVAMAGLQIAALVTNPIGAAIVAITAIIGAITLLVQNWDKVKEAGAAAWEKIKSAWNDAGGWFKGIGEKIKGAFNGIGDKISGFFSDGWNKIKNTWNTATSFFSNIKNGIHNAFSNIGGILTGIFSSAWNGIRVVWSGVTSFFSGIGSNIKGAISGSLSTLPRMALNWARDFMQGFGRGIMNAMDFVTRPIRNLADMIWKNLHFSKPEEGPLRDYETWMPDFVKGLARGLTQSAPILTRAAEGLAGQLATSAQNITLGAAAAESTAQPVYMQVDGHTFARLMSGYIDQQQGENWTNMALGLG